VLASPVGEDVEVRWRAYQLAPRLPLEGVDRARYYQSRFGSDGRKVPTRIAEEAASEGLTMNFAAIGKMPNTFLGHRLMHHAESTGGSALQHLLAEALFQAYFQAGRDVGDKATLVAIACSVGMDPVETLRYLDSDEGTTEVQAELARAVDLGVSGVPCFVLGGTFPVPGAQSAEVMAAFITRAKSRLAG